MTKRKIMLITVCFAIFAISLLLSRQFFKSAGKRNMDVPAAGSEQQMLWIILVIQLMDLY